MDKNIKDEVLLYDPIFAKKPPEGWEDSEKGGFFGKAKTKKGIFIFFLILAISCSLILSFKSLSKKKYTYDTVDSGYRLSEFNGTESDNILVVSDVKKDDGSEETEKIVTAVRNYAVCCNETIDFIFISKNVTELEYNCFYYCTNLKAIFVDEENPKYTSVDGVLYTKDMTEIIMHPIKNSEYRTALKMGLTAPTCEEDCAAFLEKMNPLFPTDSEKYTDEIKKAISETGANYTIPDTVTTIAPYCFNYCEQLVSVDIPAGVKTIGQMAFFKCKALKNVTLPDGLETIGSDGFSYCECLEYMFVPASVTEIGHHAFFGDFGLDAVYMGAADEDAVKTGESWLPNKDERSFGTIDAVYGAERRNG